MGYIISDGDISTNTFNYVQKSYSTIIVEDNLSSYCLRYLAHKIRIFANTLTGLATIPRIVGPQVIERFRI